MFLTFGVNQKGKWIGIDEVDSGKTALYCPYCKQQLIAKKGTLKEHHFAHDGKTCRISEQAAKYTELPTFDHFELLDANELKYLERRQRYKHKEIYGWVGMREAIQRLEVMQILSVNYDGERHSNDVVKATERLIALRKSLINDEGEPSSFLIDILNALQPLTGHNLVDKWSDSRTIVSTSINRKYHMNKLSKLDKFSQYESAQRYWFDAYYRKVALLCPDFLPMLNAKYHSLNNQRLYVFRFSATISGCPESFIKIGMTTRPTEERLREVHSMLSSYGKVFTSEVHCEIIHGGRLERLIHHHFAQNLLSLGSHREFFHIQGTALDQLVDDMTTYGQIAPYYPPELDLSISRCPASAGRKKKSDSEILAEYPKIIECLEKGMGIRPTSRETGYSVNTIQKVKQAMAHQAGRI